MTDSHTAREHVERHPSDSGWEKFVAIADRIWPHIAAWGLAAMIAFFAVRERLTMMELAATTVLERVKTLEAEDRRRAEEVRGIRDDTTRIRTLLEVLAKESDERRADDRARWRVQQQGER